MDELYEQAKRIVIDTQRASISTVQRRLAIKYSVAAEMLERMEQDGIISPWPSTGAPRKVLRSATESTVQQVEALHSAKD